jgi:hypothetical protein
VDVDNQLRTPDAGAPGVASQSPSTTTPSPSISPKSSSLGGSTGPMLH